MLISAYQVNNVLRVYGDQLRQSRIMDRAKNNPSPTPDKISISAEAKRKSVTETVASSIVDRITQYGPNDNVEKEVFEKLESEVGGRLAISKKSSSELIFKQIDENGETTNSLSIEDSNFLVQRLNKITRETVENKLP